MPEDLPAPRYAGHKVGPLGVNLPSITEPGRTNVETREALDNKSWNYRVDGAAGTAEAWNIANCGVVPGGTNPTLQTVTGGAGRPFLGPVHCDFQNSQQVGLERAQQQAAAQAFYDKDQGVNPNLWRLAQFHMGHAAAPSPSRMSGSGLFSLSH